MRKDWKETAASGRVEETPDAGAVSDERLFARFLHEGDESAIEELRNRYGGTIMRYINTLILNPHDAETLMQEAFGNIVLHKPDIAEGAWFRPYLYRTAYHLALRYLERQKHSEALVLEQLPREWASERQVERDYERMEERRQILLLLDQLRPAYGEALRMVYLEGLSYAEAAAEMGKSVEQVRHLVYRGKKAIRKLMDEQNQKT